MRNSLHFNSKKTQLKYRVLKIVIVLAMLFSVNSCRKETKKIRSKENHTEEILKIMNTADLFFDNNKKDSAYYYFNKALSICDPKKNPDEYVYSLTCMAEILQLEGDYITSEYILTKTTPYLKYTSRPRYKWYPYTIIANNYDNTYDFKSALIYHKKALTNTISVLKRNQTLINIAGVYSDEKNYDEAVKILLPIVTKKHIDPDNLSASYRNYAIALNELGSCYTYMDNPKALEYLNEGLRIRTKSKDEEGIMLSNRYISLYYLNKNDPKSALKYAKKAYELSAKAKYTRLNLRCLAELIECSEGDDLKRHTLNYIKLFDSLTVVRLRVKNQSAKIKYESKKEKDTNLQLKTQKIENELQLERQKNRNIISYVIITFTLGLILFLSFYLTLKGRKEKNEAIYKSEARISKKLDAELANDVYNTIIFANKEDLEQAENKEKLLNNLEAIYLRTRNISRENSHIVTDENYVFYLKEMIAGFKTTNANIFSNGLDTINWDKIERNKKIILYRVIQELFSNMKKHSKATLVSITFKIIEKNILVTYTDNGEGIENGRIILKNGLQNVENRIKTINGTVNFDNNSDKGFKLSFTFPL